MSASNFDPRNVAEQQARVAVNQGDFSAGMVMDGPADAIPENGVRHLANFINHGTYLEGRGGCKRCSTAKLPVLPNRNSYTATKSGATITVTVGFDFTADDVGNYFVWLNGYGSGVDRHYRITAVNVSGNQLTVDDSTVDVSTPRDGCSVRGSVNGTFFHKQTRKVILHIDNRIFVTTPGIASYTKAHCISFSVPQNTKSSFAEKGHLAFITAGSTFQLNMLQDPILYYAINERVPNTKLSGIGAESGSTPYCRRLMYSMSRLTGFGPRDRTTPGVSIEWESGTVEYSSDGKDYASIYTAAPISANTPVTVGDLTNPSDNMFVLEKLRQPTHYSVYATLDVGLHETDPANKVANQSELYVWLCDVPLCKVILASVASDGTITVQRGYLESYDVGSLFTNGSAAQIQIGTVTSKTSGTALNSGGGPYSGGVVGSTWWYTGCSTILGFTQSGHRLTRSSGLVNAFVVGDVGRPIFCIDGKIKYITEFVDANNVDVHDSETISTPECAAWLPNDRKFSNGTPDEVPGLRSRIRAWPLKQRAWAPLPFANGNAVGSFFLFVYKREGTKVYYSEFPLGHEYLAGYYNPLDQYMEFEDGVVDVKPHKENVSVRCFHSTHGIDLTSSLQIEDGDVGETHSILSTKFVIDGNIGCFDWGGNIFAIDDKEIVITSEPGIRPFDGRSYGENLADGKIMSELVKMQTAYSAGYHPSIGYIFFGKD